ncbi:hypothetical protein QBL02_13770 [Leucobacter sp. UT-8R-CII-1-4]|uniref:hypothetical protein n=1 Tax=Leucobacter sp. UT-8R-CII-1-4 TaxID=3040075 RepID=UPI0024A95EE3|nr:hypothetical protein [Leucobacter sp. UT-8R-CII-1-4]MDI6024605.1 hypothetical protein [Leucobacter sp. UT-8R-CII-1-4]
MRNEKSNSALACANGLDLSCGVTVATTLLGPVGRPIAGAAKAVAAGSSVTVYGTRMTVGVVNTHVAAASAVDGWAKYLEN